MAEVHAVEEAFVAAVEVVVIALEAAAAVVIVLAAARAFIRFLRRFGRGHLEGTRLDFGRSLLLALDFTIGSDVLKVATAPNLDTLLVVAGVVLVRVVLTFTLERELTHDEKTVGGAA